MMPAQETPRRSLPLIPCLALTVLALGVAFAPAAQAQQVCIQVITFAENPDTGQCIAFPTPCDVPPGWAPCGPGPISVAVEPEPNRSELEPSPTESAVEMGGPGVCAQVITFARNPATGQCEAFPTPCDVPDGWELCGFPSFP